MEMDKESLSVGGYRFFTEKDAQLARYAMYTRNQSMKEFSRHR